MKVKYLDTSEVHIKSNDKGIVIEGFANANTVDRMKERIEPDGWELDNYRNVPTVLFDHGHDPNYGFLPVGKCVEVEAQKGGLYCKIKISESKTEKLTAIRDLVEEGALKAFSVGFEPKEYADEKSADGNDVRVITRAELLENSIVPIPMNQDSTFSLLGKKLLGSRNDLAKRWFKGYKDRLKLHHKGAHVQVAIRQRMYDMIEQGKCTEAQLLKEVSKISEISVKDIRDFLNGETKQVAGLVEAFSRTLNIDKDLLKDISNGDLVLLNDVEQRKILLEVKSEEQNEPKDEDNEADIKTSNKQNMVAVSLKLPKEAASSEDEARKAAEESGYDVESVSDDGDVWLISLSNDLKLDLENTEEIALSDGTIAVVAPSLEEGGDKTLPMEEEDEEEKEDEGKEFPPKKEGEEDKEEEEDEEDKKKNLTSPIVTNDALPDDNPYLELMRSQLAMTGALLNEFQSMSAKMDGLVSASLKAEMSEPETSEEEEKEEEEISEDLQKTFDAFITYKGDLEKSLKRLKV